MKTGVIKRSWLKLAPDDGLDQRFWLAVADHMETNKLEDTPENVRGAITSVQMARSSDFADARVKRDKAAGLTDEARALEASWR